MKEQVRSEEHPSPEDVAAYLDGTMGGEARERLEAHAAECEACRRELAEVAAAGSWMRQRPNWRIWAPAVAAAAAVALLLARPFSTETAPDGTARFRGPDSIAGSEGSVNVRIVAPSEDAAASPTDVVFVWRAGGAGTSYQLTLTDGEGGVVWTLSTTDTVASLPDTIALARGSLYHWYVDGLLEDGRHGTSGVRSFTTRP